MHRPYCFRSELDAVRHDFCAQANTRAQPNCATSSGIPDEPLQILKGFCYPEHAGGCLWIFVQIPEKTVCLPHCLPLSSAV